MLDRKPLMLVAMALANKMAHSGANRRALRHFKPRSLLREI
jgi:hypothetical protein